MYKLFMLFSSYLLWYHYVTRGRASFTFHALPLHYLCRSKVTWFTVYSRRERIATHRRYVLCFGSSHSWKTVHEHCVISRVASLHISLFFSLAGNFSCYPSQYSIEFQAENTRLIFIASTQTCVKKFLSLNRHSHRLCMVTFDIKWRINRRFGPHQVRLLKDESNKSRSPRKTKRNLRSVKSDQKEY